MKKLLIVLLVAVVLMLIANLFFSANDFKQVPVGLEVSAYDYANEEFLEAFMIEDQVKIEDFIQALNKARHQNGAYEVSRSEDYQVKMTYQDGLTDTLRIWLDYGEGFDMFRTEKTVGTYKLKNDGAREAVREILK